MSEPLLSATPVVSDHADLAHSLTTRELRQVRWLMLRRWGRAILGRLILIAGVIGLFGAGVIADHMSISPYLPELIGIALVGVCLFGSASRRLLNLRSLASAPVQTTDGPILLMRTAPWLTVGNLFTGINPWDHWMHLLPALQGRLDPTARYRIVYLRLRYPPDCYVAIRAIKLGPASKEEITALEKHYSAITPEWTDGD